MSDDDDNREGYGPWDSNRHGKFNGRIMITAVICLFVVIALVIMLHIYACCAFRRHARRRAALCQFAIGTTQIRLNEQEPKRGGLNPSVISSLPSFVYKQVDYHTDHTIECSVCISSLEDEEI
ncbi:hypothetical protein MKW94_008882 [Papaver nudicaule]|uniref:RING-type E3 ubiquitin transferase n=1 Tax=Papaver nudicaule TaxID=74823 RepID=A0AA41SE25_PAPNU|nr:hypothetical protein [Papaver nudicaule]